MRIIILLLLSMFMSVAFGEEKQDKKEDLSGTVVKSSVSIEIREQIVSKKELDLLQLEKDIQQKAKYLEEARQQLVEEAMNVKVALDNREKEIKKKEEQSKIKSKKQPPSTKTLTELIEEVNNKHPVKN